MKHLTLLLLVAIILQGCSLTGRKKQSGLHGGTAAERQMVREELNNAYNHLKRHYPNIQPYSGWTLKLDDERAAGVERHGGVLRYTEGGRRWVYAEAHGSRKIVYARPLHRSTAFHEAIHILMYKVPEYRAASRNHGRPAFRHGGTVR